MGYAGRCPQISALQAEVVYHLVLVASADIVPKDTRGHTANVELRTMTQKPHHKKQKSNIRKNCMVSQIEPSNRAKLNYNPRLLPCCVVIQAIVYTSDNSHVTHTHEQPSLRQQVLLLFLPLSEVNYPVLCTAATHKSRVPTLCGYALG